jgi:diguanylate cyclase (GGDEF)-like protein/PAS domain S-box-containing protein
MFSSLTDKLKKKQTGTIESLIEDFSLPVFYKDIKNDTFITNEAFNLLVGQNHPKVLKQLSSLNTNVSNKFEIKLINDLDKETDVIVHISTDVEDDDSLFGIIIDISKQTNEKNTINLYKERYELATQGSDEGIWDFDIKKDEVFYSTSFKEIIGYENRPIKNHISSWLNVIINEDKAMVIKALEEHINGKTANFKSEHRIDKNGEIIWVSIRGKVTADRSRIVGFLTDITQIKEAQLALRNSEEQFQLFMRNLPAGAFIRDENNQFIFSNKYMDDLLGEETLIGKNLQDVFREEEIKNIIDNSTLIEQDTSTTEEEITDKLGNKHHFQVHRFVVNKNGKKLFGGIYSDISEQKQTEKKLNILAHYDLLTNLPNRALFQNTLRNSISKAKRTESKIALMFLDLDNFKMINDTLGHDYGDLLLIEVAKKLKSVLRVEDTVSRLGGDEFTIILDDIQDTAYPSIVAQKIIDILSQPIKLKDEMGYIGASVGISVFPDDSNEIESLIKNADMAMYEAKTCGKNIYKYFTEDMHNDAKERLALSNDLRNAVTNHQLRLYYQPIIDTNTNTLIAFEALVRWNHPKYGIITPDNFIKLAEEGGFMAKVGQWILKESCEQIKHMQNIGIEAKICVNISSKQLTQNHLEQTIRNIISDSGINPKLLELEVTENFLMENIDEVGKVLENLQNLGVSTAIDDFGTGYTSLKHLKQLPISKIKIDKSFIHDIPNNKDDMLITSMIINLAKQLSFEIVAEGVETAQQVEFLQKNGCNLMQGYYFYEALPQDEINNYLANMRS